MIAHGAAILALEGGRAPDQLQIARLKKHGGPVAILFLGPQAEMDKAYAKELSAAGFAYAVCNYYEALKPDFIKKFNTVTTIGKKQPA